MREKRCVIIGSSPDFQPEAVRYMIHREDLIACADGGYLYAQEMGLPISLIVGDFDSSTPPKDPPCPVVTLPKEKDDTDLLYVVKMMMGKGYQNFLLLGVSGGRSDHTFACYCTLSYIADQGGMGIMADAGALTTVVVEGSYTLRNAIGQGFGIFPFGCTECTVSLSGFTYELSEGKLTEDYPKGVSNDIRGNNAAVTIHEGKALMMIQLKETGSKNGDPCILW